MTKKDAPDAEPKVPKKPGRRPEGPNGTRKTKPGRQSRALHRELRAASEAALSEKLKKIAEHGIETEPQEEHGKRKYLPPPPKGWRRPGYSKNAAEDVVRKIERDGYGWLGAVDTARAKFGPTARALFLACYAETGLMTYSANEAGVASRSVNEALKNDKDFSAAFEEAKGAWRDKVLQHARGLMLNGVDEPIVGGPDKDTIVAYKRRYPESLIAMEMRHVDPGYRDKSEVDINVRQAVLVLPAPVTQEEWERLYGNPNPPDGAAPGQVVTATPSKEPVER